MTKLLVFVKHNSGIVIGTVACCCVLVWVYSCQSSVISIVNSGVKVNRTELLAEVDTFLAKAESRFEDLDRQDLVKGTIFNHAAALMSGEPLNLPGILLALGNILGIGAVVDNVRKRTFINTLKGDTYNDRLEKEIIEKLSKIEAN
jgi:hypothetical protein